MAPGAGADQAERVPLGEPLNRIREWVRRGPVIIVLLLMAFLTACQGVDVVEFAPLSGRYSALVVNADTGNEIHAENADSPRFPASLTKMMTLYMLFEAIEQGRIARDGTIPVSANAARRPPSKLGVRAGGQLPVDTAIRALAVKSANDVAAAVGEFIAGSESRFAELMTARAQSLGLTRTRFRNASGLPDEGQVTTARDMARLGILLRRRFPQYFHYFDLKEFSYNGRTIRGHNRLLGDPGVDGIKTGYIRASGFNIVTSVTRGGKRFIVVVMGGDSGRERDTRVRQLIAAYAK